MSEIQHSPGQHCDVLSIEVTPEGVHFDLDGTVAEEAQILCDACTAVICEGLGVDPAEVLDAPEEQGDYRRDN